MIAPAAEIVGSATNFWMRCGTNCERKKKNRNMKISILLAEEYSIVLEGLRVLLASQEDMEVMVAIRSTFIAVRTKLPANARARDTAGLVNGKAMSRP